MPPRKRTRNRYPVKNLTFKIIQELEEEVREARRFQGDAFRVKPFLKLRRQEKRRPVRDSIMGDLIQRTESDEVRAARFNRVRDDQVPSNRTQPRTKREGEFPKDPGREATYAFKVLGLRDDQGNLLPGEAAVSIIEFDDVLNLTAGQRRARIDGIRDKSAQTVARRKGTGGSLPIGTGLIIPIEVRE